MTGEEARPRVTWGTVTADELERSRQETAEVMARAYQRQAAVWAQRVHQAQAGSTGTGQQQTDTETQDRQTV